MYFVHMEGLGTYLKVGTFSISDCFGWLFFKSWHFLRKYSNTVILGNS